jgi:signal-transduction protein with cAMP-binding, CBS, and nucleotidyltransferase domain
LKMKEQKIKHLPVVDENEQLIGELSLGRLIQEYSKRQTVNTKMKKTEKT